MPTGIYKRSKEQIEKQREMAKVLGLTNKGEGHPNWKGGITPLRKKLYRSVEYQLWRKSVFERDNYICIWCNSNENLTTDHIKPWVDYPELRFAIDNGRTLCLDCHRTTDTWGKHKIK